MRKLLATLILFNCLSGMVYAGIPAEQAVNAVIGEALHDEVSMDAMCHALRNRGSLRGVYGYKSGRRDSPKLHALGVKTWFASLKTPDVTKGATHWLSDYDLSHCKPRLTSFRFKMVETAYIGQTHFYKGGA